MTTCKVSELISPAFFDAHRQIRAGAVDEIVCKGGRGSTKSSYISIELVLQLLQRPDCHALVLRKVAATLRNSVYNQLCWAVDALGVGQYFRRTVSPMELTYLPTGQRILCFGMDDPSKLKSIKLPFGHIGLLWLEELDQFDGEAQMRNVRQSALRGGEQAIVFCSFNPPAAARNWANRYALAPRKGKLIHHSTYETTPRAWLGEPFVAEAEYLRETNETAYRHEYLGEVVGNGTQVFDNLRTETITDAKVRGMERIYSGVDWGWYPDPWAFNRCAYDAARRTLYIFDELTRLKTPDRETAELVRARIEPGEIVTADSSENKSIDNYRSMSIKCRPAEKGAGSVKQSIKWLQSLAGIVIDPERCPDTMREFGEYEYEVARSGEVLEGYPDYNNHHIDAVRYALNRLWLRRGV